MKIILEIEGLKKYYGRPGNQTKALDGISGRKESSWELWEAAVPENPLC
mgnify:CR=1 FL=1